MLVANEDCKHKKEYFLFFKGNKRSGINNPHRNISNEIKPEKTEIKAATERRAEIVEIESCITP